MKKHIYCQHSFETEFLFFDVDAMHIVCTATMSNTLKPHVVLFLSSIGYDYNEMGRQGYSWPIVQMNLKYIRPARFGQKIRVDMDIVEIESCLRIDYTIYDVETNEKHDPRFDYPSRSVTFRRPDAVSNAGQLVGSSKKTSDI